MRDAAGGLSTWAADPRKRGAECHRKVADAQLELAGRSACAINKFYYFGMLR